MLPLRKVHFFMLKNGIPANNLLVGTGLIEADFSDPYHIITAIQARTYYLNAVSQGEEGAGLEQGGRTVAYSRTGEVLAEITLGSGPGDRWARTTTDEYVYRVSSFRVSSK